MVDAGPEPTYEEKNRVTLVGLLIGYIQTKVIENRSLSNMRN